MFVLKKKEREKCDAHVLALELNPRQEGSPVMVCLRPGLSRDLVVVQKLFFGRFRGRCSGESPLISVIVVC